MNKLFLLCVILLGAFHVEAQSISKSEVPAPVLSRVKALYPDVNKIEWENVDGLYEASFDVKKVETSLLISWDGTLVHTETEIEASAVPANIMDYIKKHHPSSGISEASRIIDLTSKVTYEIEADDIEYVFDAYGVVLSQELDEDDADDKH
jgi:hypothetical protein